MSTPQTKTYDPGLINVSVGPFPIVGGFAPGTFVKATRRTESFKDDVGAQGDVVRIRSHDKRGDIEFTLLRTASANDYFSGLIAAAEQFGGGIVPITITDNNGTTRVFGSECWLTKPADVEEGVDAQHRVWKFAVAQFETFAGGNVL
jgi:hypothetical protein